MTETPATAEPGPAVHDGLAVASLVLSLLWLGGLGSLLAVVFGWTSGNAAHQAGRKSSPLGNWGLGLGVLGIISAAILWITLIVAVSKTSSYQDCLNQAKDIGIDPVIFGCRPS